MTGQDRQLGRLSESRNRELLTVLYDAGKPLHVNELAERLVKRGETVMGAEEYADRLERERITLHHNELPRLAEAGLVDYDRAENTVSTASRVTAQVRWLDGDTFGRSLAGFRSDQRPDENAIGVIEGRRQVIEYGRALADDAAAELFCMYVSTDLLEDECLCHAENAIDRGVEMYVGSRNPDVRDLVREHLPDATLWEPQHDWLNVTPGYPTVGRLVIADRRTVMLAILEEPDSDGRYPRETALVGEGEDHPLVVLVRELLGPRLDHLDYQSTDFRSELHS